MSAKRGAVIVVKSMEPVNVHKGDDMPIRRNEVSIGLEGGAPSDELNELIGSFWMYNGHSICQLARVEAKQYVMVQLSDGNRLKDPGESYSSITMNCKYLGWFEVKLIKALA